MNFNLKADILRYFELFLIYLRLRFNYYLIIFFYHLAYTKTL